LTTSGGLNSQLQGERDLKMKKYERTAPEVRKDLKISHDVRSEGACKTIRRESQSRLRAGSACCVEKKKTRERTVQKPKRELFENEVSVEEQKPYRGRARRNGVLVTWDER